MVAVQGRALQFKFILPALTEAESPFWRPIKYSLFPPLGLATLAAFLNPDDEAEIIDQHVERLDLSDKPDVVAIQVYITNAFRSYAIADHYRAKGCFVILGGLHVTSLPDEASLHADAIFIGPAEASFPEFLNDFRSGTPKARFQGAATIDSILNGDLIERAADAGLRSLFVGFESLVPENLSLSNKKQNLGKDYHKAIDKLHDLGIMINGSFVFGLDGDTKDVFEKTVAWGIEMGLTTSTFHIATPYPDTAYYKEIENSGRLLTKNWNLFDTRHVVYQPKHVSAEKLEEGYRWAYDEFYKWGSIFRSSLFHGSAKHQLKHFFYTSGWKKFEPLWNTAIQLKKLGLMTPMLEAILSKVSKRGAEAADLAIVE